MESFLRDEVDMTYVTRVAVAPFENNSKEQFAPERVRGMAITEILSQGLFDVVDKGLVDSAFREEAVDLSKGPMDAGVMKRLGQRINVQAFLMGSIDQAGDVQRGQTSFPALAITLRLVDAHTGMIFWQASGSQTGDSLGKRLFGLGSDDEFKVSLRLLRQLLATISSERKVKLPTSTAAAPVIISPEKTEAPPAIEPETMVKEESPPPEEVQEPVLEDTSEALAPSLGEEEPLDLTAPGDEPSPMLPETKTEDLAQPQAELPSNPPEEAPFSMTEPSSQPEAGAPAVESSEPAAEEEMQPAEQSSTSAEEEEMQPADQSAPLVPTPAPSDGPAKEAAPSLQLDQAWPE